jgi:hypothetical protein
MGMGKALAGGAFGCVIALFACGKTIPLDEANLNCPCAPGWSCCDAADGGPICKEGSCSLIDDMRHVETSLGTSWYAYSDRTCPLSCPPLFMAGAKGTLTPEEDEPFRPTEGDGPWINGIQWPYREVKGDGESTWGVGFGFDIQDERAPSPVAKCGPDWCTGTARGPANGEIECEGGHYTLQPMLTDESAHLGISFWARAVKVPDGGPFPQLFVLVSDKQSSPRGGVCNPCLLSGPNSCNDDPETSFGLTSTWQQHHVLFSKLMSQGFSTHQMPVPLDPKTVFHINFEIHTPQQTETDSGDTTTFQLPLRPFDVQIAYVEWADWIDE